MKFHSIILIIGITLIIIASVIFVVIYEEGLQNKKVLSISPSETRDYTFNIKEQDKYIIYLNSNYNVSYLLIHNNLTISSGSNIREEEINITGAYGTYTLKIKNVSNKTASVMIIVAKVKDMQIAKHFTIISGGICAIGMIVSVVGLGLLLWHRKKEEKQYSRY